MPSYAPTMCKLIIIVTHRKELQFINRFSCYLEKNLIKRKSVNISRNSWGVSHSKLAAHATEHYISMLLKSKFVEPSNNRNRSNFGYLWGIA